MDVINFVAVLKHKLINAQLNVLTTHVFSHMLDNKIYILYIAIFLSDLCYCTSFFLLKKVLVLNLAVCATTHIHYATDESLEFEEIGSVNRSYQFTYSRREEEDSWPGML